MKQSIYSKELNELLTILDTAIEAFKLHPPKNFNDDTVNHTINTYSTWKNMAMNPKPEHQNVKSLKYLKEDALTYFQEGSGSAVSFFWQEVERKGLNIHRENKLSKILKRNKIKNTIEYDFVIDAITPAYQDQLITKEEVDKLNSMLNKFEEEKRLPR